MTGNQLIEALQKLDPATLAAPVVFDVPDQLAYIEVTLVGILQDGRILLD